MARLDHGVHLDSDNVALKALAGYNAAALGYVNTGAASTTADSTTELDWAPATQVHVAADAAVSVLVIVGLLLAMPIGVGLFVDYLGDSVHSPVGFARDLGEICLAAVPKSRALSPRRLRNDDGLVSLNEFRVMRSSLRLVWGEQAPRVIGIISGHAREGRSTVTLQLARALVEQRRRAAILDADLRTVGMAPKLGMRPKFGLLQVLSG